MPYEANEELARARSRLVDQSTAREWLEVIRPNFAEQLSETVDVRDSPVEPAPRPDPVSAGTGVLSYYDLGRDVAAAPGPEGHNDGGSGMMICAIRSVQLSTDTADAWKEGGVRLAPRGRNPEHIMEMGYDLWLNLGKSDFNPVTLAERVWNAGENIVDLINPGSARRLIGQYMPPHPTEYPAQVWVKAPGAHGRGKYLETVEEPLVVPPTWDWCKHINGQEYRLVTVGNRLVQDFLRHGDNDTRIYEWVAMSNVPIDLKRMVRKAAASLEGNNVIAWDAVIDEDGTPYLFEGNTCPGVNVETVQRITVEMERQWNECQ